MGNDTAVLTLIIELQNDRTALRQRIVELEAALAEAVTPRAD